MGEHIEELIRLFKIFLKELDKGLGFTKRAYPILDKIEELLNKSGR